MNKIFKMTVASVLVFLMLTCFAYAEVFNASDCHITRISSNSSGEIWVQISYNSDGTQVWRQFSSSLSDVQVNRIMAIVLSAMGSSKNVKVFTDSSKLVNAIELIE